VVTYSRDLHRQERGEVLAELSKEARTHCDRIYTRHVVHTSRRKSRKSAVRKEYVMNREELNW